MIGVGGLGHMAVQILRALTPARIVAVDVASDKLRLAREVGAREVGAHEVVESGAGATEALRELTGGLGAQMVLDFVGADATMALARSRCGWVAMWRSSVWPVACSSTSSVPSRSTQRSRFHTGARPSS